MTLITVYLSDAIDDAVRSVILLQTGGTPPAAFTEIGSFDFDYSDKSRTVWHHVRDALHFVGIHNMNSIKIYWKDVYTKPIIDNPVDPNPEGPTPGDFTISPDPLNIALYSEVVVTFTDENNVLIPIEDLIIAQSDENYITGYSFTGSSTDLYIEGQEAGVTGLNFTYGEVTKNLIITVT